MPYFTKIYVKLNTSKISSSQKFLVDDRTIFRMKKGASLSTIIVNPSFDSDGVVIACDVSEEFTNIAR